MHNAAGGPIHPWNIVPSQARVEASFAGGTGSVLMRKTMDRECVCLTVPWLFPEHFYQCKSRGKDLLEKCHQEVQ